MLNLLRQIIRPLWYLSTIVCTIAFLLHIVLFGIVIKKPLYEESTGRYNVRILTYDQVLSKEEYKCLSNVRSRTKDLGNDLGFPSFFYLLLYEYFLWPFDPKGKVSPLGYKGDYPVKRR